MTLQSVGICVSENRFLNLLSFLSRPTGGASAASRASEAASPLHAHVRQPQLRRHETFLLPSRLVPHRHRPRAELQPAHELQVYRLR
jgi:hypothetical protein